jgi:hypothetical protein
MKTSVENADATASGTEMFGLELMVLCAEAAVQVTFQVMCLVYVNIVLML